MIYNNINILLSKTYKFKQNKFHRNKQYKLFKTNKIYFIWNQYWKNIVNINFLISI